jgi:hypothetical protein
LYTHTSDVIGLKVADLCLVDIPGPTFHRTFSQSPFPNLPAVQSCLSIPAGDSLLIVLFDPALPDVSQDIVDATIATILRIYNDCDLDIPYTLSLVDSFSLDDVAALSRLSFSVVNYHPSELLVNTFLLLTKTGIASRAGIDHASLLKFIVVLRRNYNAVPYHSWFHALDATQFVFSVISLVDLRSYLEDQEIFALVMSTLCHDTDHPGLNNAFHRKAATVLAHLAPKLPPLEHHHSCISNDLLRVLLAPLAKTDRRAIRHYIIECIMSTDMEQHKSYLEAFKQLNPYDRKLNGHRLLVGQMILKAADLSNVVRDFDEAARMATKLGEECRAQGALEIEIGVPISPMCDPSDQTPLCVGQIGFYSFVAGPLMAAVCDFFPELQIIKSKFDENLEAWKKKKQELDNAKAG